MKERFQLKWNREERMISNKKKRVDNTKVKILNLDEAGWGLGSMIIFMCIIIIFIIIVAVEIKRVDEMIVLLRQPLVRGLLHLLLLQNQIIATFLKLL